MKAVFIYDPSDFEIMNRIHVFPASFIDGFQYTTLLGRDDSWEVPDGQILSPHDIVVKVIENVDMEYDEAARQYFVGTNSGVLKGRITKK